VTRPAGRRTAAGSGAGARLHRIRLRGVRRTPAVLLAALLAAAPPGEAGQLMGATVAVNARPLAPEYHIGADGSVRVRICFNASCARTEQVTFSGADMAAVQAQLDACPGGALHERLQRLRIAVWQMEVLAAHRQPLLANDRAINDDIGIDGRTDCVDNATNTSTFLRILADLGALPGWRVGAPAVRKPLDLNRVHWTAVAIDARSGQPWAVDAWYRPHGHLPFVLPLADWRRERNGWEAPLAALNPYPRFSDELCERP